MNWLFAAEAPLPAGLELEVLANATQELTDNRFAEAQSLVGEERAGEIAHQLGPYELEEGLARKLELEGLKLGAAGEFNALTPAKWGKFPEAESWLAFTARLAESGGEIRGLLLNGQQREDLLRFLSRNRVNTDCEPTELVNLARHFFFEEPLNVVVRYTGPRFHHS